MLLVFRPYLLIDPLIFLLDFGLTRVVCDWIYSGSSTSRNFIPGVLKSDIYPKLSQTAHFPSPPSSLHLTLNLTLLLHLMELHLVLPTVYTLQFLPHLLNVSPTIHLSLVTTCWSFLMFLFSFQVRIPVFVICFSISFPQIYFLLIGIQNLGHLMQLYICSKNFPFFSPPLKYR